MEGFCGFNNFTIEYLYSFMYPKGVAGNAHFLTYLMTIWL